MGKRTHSKVSKLPAELREAVNALLLSGLTYDEIAAFLREKGVEIGRSSVGRYGKNFHEKLARLAQVREQAKAIVEEVGDRPATEMHEAANQLAIQQIFERLLDAKDDIEEASIVKLIGSVANLERSAVWRENAKLRFKKAAEKAADEVEKIGKAAGISPEVLKEIRERVYGIVD